MENKSIYSEYYKLQYRDINKFGKLSDFGLLQILQEIAGRHSSSLGYGLADIPRTHITWLLLGWRIKKIKDIESEEKIKVETWSSKVEKATFYREFKIYNSKDELAIIAESKWVAINVETHSILRDSDTITNLLNVYSSFEFSVFEEESPKLKPIDEEPLSVFNYTIERRDIDTNNHVNNSVYLSIALESIPYEVFENLDYSNLEILYKHEAYLGDKIVCKYNSFNNGFMVSMYSEDLSKLHAIIKYTKQ